MIGQWVNDFLQSLQLYFLRGRMVDFKQSCLFDSLDSVSARIEPGAKDDNLIKPFIQARPEEILDVPFSGSDELDCPRSESSVYTGINRQSAEEKLISGDQRAGKWIVANPRFFRS